MFAAFPFACKLDGVAVTTTLAGDTAVWVITAVPVTPPAEVSVAVMVHCPGVVLGVYVTDPSPAESVVTGPAPRVPQAPAGEPLEVKAIESPATGAPFLVAVAVTVEVLAPSGRRTPRAG